MKIWYSVQNGGDGSAYPQFFENKRLTEIDQELMEEGWGEPCNGYIEIEGENMTILHPNVTTKEEFIEDLKERVGWTVKYGGSTSQTDKIQEFIQELEEGIIM